MVRASWGRAERIVLVTEEDEGRGAGWKTMLACASSEKGLSEDGISYLLIRVRLISSGNNSSETWKIGKICFDRTSTLYNVMTQEASLRSDCTQSTQL